MTINIKTLSAKITGLEKRSANFDKDLDVAISQVIELLETQPCINQANRIVELVNRPTKVRLITYFKARIPFKYNSEKGFTKLDKSKVEKTIEFNKQDTLTFSAFIKENKAEEKTEKPAVDYGARISKNVDAMLKQSEASGVAVQVVDLDSVIEALQAKREELVKLTLVA